MNLQKRIVMIVGIIAVIVIVIVVVVMQSPQNMIGTSTTPTTSNTSIRELLASGKSQKCTFSLGTTSGTVYVANGQFREDTLTTQAASSTIAMYNINNGAYSYIWPSPTDPTLGLKVKLTKPTDRNINASLYESQTGVPTQKIDMTCEPWASESTTFTIPTDINFKEYTITGTDAAQPNTNQPTDNQPSMDKLGIETVKAGTGPGAQAGNTVTVQYTGTLIDGTVFDSSRNPGRTPFSFTLGQGSVIQGWEQGVLGMKVGEERKLTIPSSLGYGDNGYPPAIPPKATLLFDIELLSIK